MVLYHSPLCLALFATIVETLPTASNNDSCYTNTDYDGLRELRMLLLIPTW